MNTIDTREAGGGSYPEPPQAWYGSEPEACEECGYTADDLKRVGERLLCPACRRKYWFEHAEAGDFAKFISDDFTTQTEFYLDWFFAAQGKPEKLFAAKWLFATENSEMQRDEMRRFTAMNKGDFAKFMEEKYGI